jgi:hypothetical protein
MRPYLVTTTRGRGEDWAVDNSMLMSGLGGLVHILCGVKSLRVRSGNNGGQDTPNRLEKKPNFWKSICERLLICHIL